MTQPTAYTPAFNFAAFQSSTPNTLYPGVRLDAEFNALNETLDQVLVNLALLQRDDGKLANNSVTIDQISDSAKAVLGSKCFNVRGSWVAGDQYFKGDIVEYGGSLYLAIADYVSGIFATDQAAKRLVGPVFTGA